MQSESSAEGGQEPSEPENLRSGLSFDVAFESMGKVPGANEDALLYMPESGVMAVFDALGGNKATKTTNPAEIARAAVTEECRDAPVVSTTEGEEDRLRRAIVAANETLYLENMEKGTDLATTVAMTRLWSTSEGAWKATIASVGDSRVYRFRGGKLEMLTLDHSLQSLNEELSEAELWKIQEKLSNYGDPGQPMELTEFERNCFELRAAVGEALGTEKIPVPRILTIDILGGDMIFDMSDGAPENLTTGEMEGLIAEGGTAAEIIKRLINAARARSQQSDHLRAHTDDMTIVGAIALG